MIGMARTTKVMRCVSLLQHRRAVMPCQYAPAKHAYSDVAVEGCRGFRSEELNLEDFKDRTLRSLQQIVAFRCW